MKNFAEIAIFVYNNHTSDLDPASAESRSRKQLGSSNRSIIGDASQWSKVYTIAT